jgi:hypothetical protein
MKVENDEEQIGRGVARALDEAASRLPDETLGRLAAARAQAMARKKNAVSRKPFAFALLVRSARALAPWLAGAAAAAALVAIQPVAPRAPASAQDTDFEMLSGETPLNAWTDPGFGAYLEQLRETEDPQPDNPPQTAPPALLAPAAAP